MESLFKPIFAGFLILLLIINEIYEYKTSKKYYTCKHCKFYGKELNFVKCKKKNCLMVNPNNIKCKSFKLK